MGKGRGEEGGNDLYVPWPRVCSSGTIRESRRDLCQSGKMFKVGTEKDLGDPTTSPAQSSTIKYLEW